MAALVNIQDPLFLLRDLESSLSFCPRPYQTRRAFFERYREQFHSVDGFVCSVSTLAPRAFAAYLGDWSGSQVPLAFCEAFMPFDRPMLLWAQVPLEFGRENRRRLDEWTANLHAIARRPNTVVAASDRYTLECANLPAMFEP